MEISNQTFFISTLQDQPQTISAYDLLTGTLVANFKDGGIANKNCVQVFGDNEYLISSEKDKPRIHIWSLNKKKNFHKTMITPGIINGLLILPSSDFLLCAIGTKIYIWMLSTGNLIMVLERHYQKITCLKCSHDGYYFISGSQDGHCLLWEVSELFENVSQQSLQGLTKGINEPKYTWSDHLNEITDAYCGNYLISSSCIAKCLTVSIDCSCKIYNVLDGNLIVSIIFESPVYSLGLDSSEMNLFTGCENGKIYQTKLFEEMNDYKSNILKSKADFIGHTDKVINLSLSIDGLCLLSSSIDNSVKKWHIVSKNCMETFIHKSSILNCYIITTPKALIHCNTNSTDHFNNLKKEISSQIKEETNDTCIEIKLNNFTKQHSIFDHYNQANLNNPNLNSLNFASNQDDLIKIKKELNDLKKINKHLYHAQLNKIYQNKK